MIFVIFDLRFVHEILMKTTLIVLALFHAAQLLAQNPSVRESPLVFAVTFDAARSAVPLDGRLVLLLSTDPAEEPRFQINDSLKSQIVFGLDIEDWKPGEVRTMDASNAGVFGHPVSSLRSLNPGEYTVQALLDRYETFHRADGHVLKLPTDCGEGRQWNRAPGNIYSKPQKLRLDSTASGRIALRLTEEIPPIRAPVDTPFVKHIRIQSDRLSKFWGRPIFLGAHVLLPAGFDAHPEARFPLRNRLTRI